MAKKVKNTLIDLESELLLRVQGEVGKNNTLPWDTLRKIGDSLQELIKSIAKTDVAADDPVNLENYEIEMIGFYKGSAVPAFRLTPHVQTTINDVSRQRKEVSAAFSSLMMIANSGNYLKLNEKYKTDVVKKEVAQKLYGFVSSFGNAPVEIVKRDGDSLRSVYRVNRFLPDAYDAVMPKETERPKSLEYIEEKAVGKVILKKGVRKTTKVVELYKNKSTMVAYSPKEITYVNKVYILNSALPSELGHEGKFVTIENDMLGISATGKTEGDAEFDFAREFDFIYQRYNQLKDSEMTTRIRRIKLLLNAIVKEVKTI